MPTWHDIHLVGQGILIVKPSRSHSDTPHSVGFLWTSVKLLPRDFYLTTHNTDNKQTSMCMSAGGLAIPASEWPKSQTIDNAAISGPVKEKNTNLNSNPQSQQASGPRAKP